MLQSLLQNILNALQWGSFYSLIALGYCLVYGVLLLINFAHGDIFMNLCSWIKVVDFGATIAEGTPEEIQNNPEVIKAYLGDDTI